jgi:RNA polymerase sigma-70 factor (ECF subfamily)
MQANFTQDRELIELLAEVARSDRRAFHALYQKTAPQIYAVLLRMFQTDAEAEDALQETFVKIWKSAANYEPQQGRPLSWMISIARYHALDVLRSQGSRGKRDRDYASHHDRSDDIFYSLDAQVADDQLLSICLERLEPGARECLVNAYCAGYTHQELSDNTGVALGTVKSWIKRSLRALRECINELS